MTRLKDNLETLVEDLKTAFTHEEQFCIGGEDIDDVITVIEMYLEEQ